ncbi:GNAT family N-acetyltransferase [Deinococcus sp.]|uniref:GNAT family N-acetyltransferase n=1 Tax=Deinococcus sp. TaxID=47478 RepID=UPI003CC54CA9
MSALKVRPALPTDLEAAARVYTLARPGNPATAARLSAEDAAQQNVGAHHRRWLALAQGEVVGVAELVEPLGSRAPGSFWMELAVAEEWRGRGAGTLLYRTLLEDAQGQRLHRLKAVVSEANPTALRFAATRGFQEVERFWDRTLELSSFGAARHLHRTPAGLDFLNLSEFMARQPESLEALHALSEEARLDLPRAPGETAQALPLSATQTFFAGFDPALVTLALSQDTPRPLGYVALEPSGVPGELLITMTGVARAERGKGVARAVKVASMLAAQAAGWERVRTTNHSSNLPMLRVNDALGFGREPARLGLLREWPRQNE